MLLIDLRPLLKWIRKKRKFCLNSVEAAEELIAPNLDVNQNVLKKNSETFKALLGIPYSHIDTSFDIPSDFEPSIKERFTFINDNRNTSDDEQYNIKYNKNNLPTALNKELEEERIKGAERILELLRSNISSNVNNENENISSNQINNTNSFKYEVEKNESYSLLHSKASYSPENVTICTQVSSNTLDGNTVLDHNDKNTFNEDALLLMLLGKQKKYDLDKKSLSQEKNLDIENNKIMTVKLINTHEHSKHSYKSIESKSCKNSSSQLLTSHSSFVTRTGGTAIEELDAQLLLYLENVVMKVKMEN